MLNFLIRRLIFILFILFTISLLIFTVTEILPGDAAAMILGQRATPETLTALRIRLGLDQPAYLRYLHWVVGILQGNWGESLVMNLPVGPLLTERLYNSMALAILALLVGTPLGILLGAIAAFNQGCWIDRIVTIFTITSVSLPSFVTAIFLIIVFASWLRWFPASSFIAPDANLWTSAKHLVLPVLTLIFGLLAHITRHTRSSLIEVLGSDYLRTAVGKGLSHHLVLIRHALPNALLPTISVVALNVGWLLSGVVLVESIFGYPGLGRLMLQALDSRDIPLLQAVTLVSAAVYALANLGADLLYGWLNPRIRYT